MAISKAFNILLISCVCIKFAFSLPYSNTCEDQLLSYRKFILTAVLNFEDICDTPIYENDERSALATGGGFIRSDDIRNRPEVWAFFRMLMAQFKDFEFISILKDAIIEKCKEKSQNDKRDGVIIGKKQRFHSWGGKRSNTNVPQDSLYSNLGIKTGIGGGKPSESTKFGWTN